MVPFSSQIALVRALSFASIGSGKQAVALREKVRSNRAVLCQRLFAIQLPLYRIKWFDGWENHKLNLDNYNSGLAAPYNSWALLEKED